LLDLLLLPRVHDSGSHGEYGQSNHELLVGQHFALCSAFFLVHSTGHFNLSFLLITNTITVSNSFCSFRRSYIFVVLPLKIVAYSLLCVK
jgi:hypothetical protein